MQVTPLLATVRGRQTQSPHDKVQELRLEVKLSTSFLNKLACKNDPEH